MLGSAVIASSCKRAIPLPEHFEDELTNMAELGAYAVQVFAHDGKTEEGFPVPTLQIFTV